MKERGGCLFIATGLILGLAVGLLVSLVLSPVEYVDITPALLGKEHKDIYRGLIAASYQSRGDLGRAKARLELLKDPNPVQVLAAQAQQTIAQGGLAQEARGLALLAAAKNENPIQITEPAASEVAAVAQTPTATDFPTMPPLTEETGTPEASATDEPVVFPTLEPLPQYTGDPFVLKDRKGVCDLEIMNLLQVYVIDKAGKPVPGVEAIVTWQGGEDHFYTGLKPSIDPGYSDFLMNPDELYNLRLANGSEAATKLTPPNCKLDSGFEYKGGIKLIFGLP
jgi:hypothetical protein